MTDLIELPANPCEPHDNPSEFTVSCPARGAILQYRTPKGKQRMVWLTAPEARNVAWLLNQAADMMEKNLASPTIVRIHEPAAATFDVVTRDVVRS
jgi:hypothetical protein